MKYPVYNTIKILHIALIKTNNKYVICQLHSVQCKKREI